MCVLYFSLSKYTKLGLLVFLLNLFETFSFTFQTTLLPRAGWVPLSFLEAGVSPEAVFRAFEALFQSRVSKSSRYVYE